MRRKIKIRFVDFWNGIDHEQHIITKCLRQNFDVEICDDDTAEYVFFSVMSYTHLDVPKQCVKIFYTGENCTPDFNVCDYALGFDWLEFGDRYMRLPNYYFSAPQQERTVLVDAKHILPSSFDLAKDKPEFCSFVVSNANGCSLRGEMFEKLSAYKKVSSGGKYKNNIGGPVADKMAFIGRSKFNIAFENSSTPGYSTEKITEAFAARTIPIYWGDPEVTRIFNPKAFINVKDYPSLDAVIKRIIELDQDDEAYIEMLRQPAWQSEDFKIANYQQRLADFLKNIVDQTPIEKAWRYDRLWYGPIVHDTLLHLRDSAAMGLRTYLREWVRYRFHV